MIIGLSGKKQSGKDTVAKIIQYLMYGNRNSTAVCWDLDTFLNNPSITEGVRYGHSGWQTKKFADKLKDIVCLLIGCTREQLEDNDFKEKELGEEWWCFKRPNEADLVPYRKESKYLSEIDTWNLIKLTPRLILQLLGTECGRQIIHPNIWVNSLMSGYKPHGIHSKSQQSLDNIIEYPNWIITDVRFPNEARAIKNRGGKLIRIERTSWMEEIDNGDSTKTLTANKQFNKIDLHESETALDNYKEFDWLIKNDGTIEELGEQVKLALWNFKLI